MDGERRTARSTAARDHAAAGGVHREAGGGRRRAGRPRCPATPAWCVLDTVVTPELAARGHRAATSSAWSSRRAATPGWTCPTGSRSTLDGPEAGAWTRCARTRRSWRARCWRRPSPRRRARCGTPRRSRRGRGDRAADGTSTQVKVQVQPRTRGSERPRRVGRTAGSAVGRRTRLRSGDGPPPGRCCTWRTAVRRQRWAELQSGRGIPPEIRARVDWNPWQHEPSWFAALDARGHAVASGGAGAARPRGAVLDVGCGGGDAAFALDRARDRTDGVDRQRDMLDVFAATARDRAMPARACRGRGRTSRARPGGPTWCCATTCCTTSSTCRRSCAR